MKGSTGGQRKGERGLQCLNRIKQCVSLTLGGLAEDWASQTGTERSKSSVTLEKRSKRVRQSWHERRRRAFLCLFEKWVHATLTSFSIICFPLWESPLVLPPLLLSHCVFSSLQSLSRKDFWLRSTQKDYLFSFTSLHVHMFPLRCASPDLLYIQQKFVPAIV